MTPDVVAFDPETGTAIVIEAKASPLAIIREALDTLHELAL